MKTVLPFLCALAFAAPADAASIAKTYSYFSIGGSTLEEIESELSSRGPQVKSTGRRHPGATQMEFTTRLGFKEAKGGCSVVPADVTVAAKVILPRWKKRSGADEDVKFVWDTLSADIKRHEESHVLIAKNHARELEHSLKALTGQKDCKTAQAKAKAITNELLARHDAAQDRFDRIEGINFESRLLRLLQYRLERSAAGKP